MNSVEFLELLTSVSLQAVLMVGGADWLGRRTNPRLQARLWTACYGLLLMLATAGASLPHPRLWRDASRLGIDDQLGLVDFEHQLGMLLFSVWMVGTVISLAWLVIRMVRAARFLSTCTPLPADEPVCEDLAALIDAVNRAGVTGSPVPTPRLLTSAQAAGPFCWQFHRPCLVLPSFLLDLDRQELRMILRHELEHLRTGHPLQLFLQHVAEALFWFHPVIWWASRRAAAAREFACDDAAVATSADVGAYLRILLRIVERNESIAAAHEVSLHFVREQSVLVQRANRLVAGTSSVATHAQVTRSGQFLLPALSACALLSMTVWLPVNALASPRSAWSPWPAWTARALSVFDVAARDYEVYDGRLEQFDLRRDQTNVRRNRSIGGSSESLR